MKLESIPAGFQDIYEGVADEGFENPTIENVVGDGTQLVEKTGEKTLQLTVRAGTVGSNTSFDVRVDGHVGEGDAPVVTQFDYDTISPDATTVSFTKTRREKIPAPTPPE